MNLAATVGLIEAGGPGSGCHGPNCGRPPNAQLNEGDKVRLLKPVKAWSEKTWNRKTFQPGAIASVTKVVPAIPGQPERVLVKFGKWGSEELIPADHVEFHKEAKAPLGYKIKSKPIEDDKALMKVKLPEGGRYGVAKPPREANGPRGVQNLETHAHALKGQFEQTDKVYGFSDTPGHEGQNLRTFTYEANKPDGSGTFVWVHKYTEQTTGKVKSTVIGEVNYTDDKYKLSTPKSFTYNNPAKAFKTLRDRYGIQMTTKNWRALP